MFGANMLPALVLLLGASPAEASLQENLEAQYNAIGRAITEEDLPVLVSTAFRTVDGDGLDVERIWKENFAAVRSYGPVEFQVLSLAEENDEVVVEVKRRIFFNFEGDESQQFEQGRSRDRWRKVDGRWRLVDRDELPGKLTGVVKPERKPSSPRLLRLQQDVAQGQATALAEFWQESHGKCPLVETIDGEADQRIVTFLWRDDSRTEHIEVRGGPFENSRTPFDRLPGTDVWYHSEKLKRDARYVYSLIVDRWVDRKRSDGGADRVLAATYPLDPLNPLTFNAGSVLELPDAPRDAWHIARENVAKGILEECELKSAALAQTRRVTVYLPPGFDAQVTECAFAVFLDGEDCRQLMNLPTVLDNLIALGTIRPTIGLFVDSQGTRGSDLVFSDPFVEFLAGELVPWAAEKTGQQPQPERTLVAGMSLGGLTAAYAAQQRPDVFGNVLSQSGSFWRRRPDRPEIAEGWLPGEIAMREKASIRYFMEVGLYEAPGMVENNRRMRDVLRAKGYAVLYAEYSGGHDHVNWRVSVGRGLMALLGR